jgi:hypothetical protein
MFSTVLSLPVQALLRSFSGAGVDKGKDEMA